MEQDMKRAVRGSKDPGRPCSTPGEETWTEVTVMLHGPFDALLGQKYLVTMLDHSSGWLLGQAMECGSVEQVAGGVAKYIFSALCTFGFCRCVFVEVDRLSHDGLFDLILRQFLNHLDSLLLDQKLLKTDLMLTSSSILRPLDQQLQTDVDKLVSTWPQHWDQHLDSWLFKHRTSLQGPHSRLSPFHLLFQDRLPFSHDLSNDSNEVQRRRRSARQTSVKCDQCSEAFRSRTSLRLHLAQHERRKTTTTTAAKRAGPSVTVSPPLTEAETHRLMESTVPTVKVLLAATKEVRSKRGKYFKYTPELKYEIAEYADKHGNMQAARAYTDKLGNPLSESTVRSFVKFRQMVPQQLKEEIGQHASQFGANACLEQYKSRMDGLTLAMVKRFCRQFEAQERPDDVQFETDGDRVKSAQLFDAGLRQDIGRYAFHCGNARAVKHFSQKLQCCVKESTVRKFKQAWRIKHGMSSSAQSTPAIASQPAATNGGTADMDLINALELPDSDVSGSPGTCLPAASGQEASSVKCASRKPAKSPRTRPRKEMKRGHYAYYSPELRSEIAKFAVQHTNQETILHFRKKSGILLPESTVRCIRDRYVRKGMNADRPDVRGRPLRLGKYDAVVRDCILQLIQSGEKPSYFMVIAAAKHVLLQHEPSLLEEHGGHIKLNPAWAKSFLVRLGL